MLKYAELTNNKITLAQKIPLNTPFGMFIDPTNVCNFHCSFCARNQADFNEYAGKYRHMSLDLFKKIINDIGDFPEKIKVIRLYYAGEPLLCPSFLSMLEYAMREGVAERIEITTNASLLSKSMAEGILQIAQTYPQNKLYMRYSIYGVDQKKNEKITGSKIPVETIWENIRRFQELRDTMQVKNVSTYAKTLKTYNPQENEDFFTRYKNVVDQAELEMPMQWSSFGKRNLLADAYTQDDVNKVYTETPKMPKVCAYPFHTMAVQSDGDVVCCCVDWSRHTRIGNVNEASLYEIWNGERLKNIRDLMLAGQRSKIDSCSNCHRLPAQECDNLDSLMTKKGN